MRQSRRRPSETKPKKTQKARSILKKTRRIVVDPTDETFVFVHCVHLCGVVYRSLSRSRSQSEWTKTLRRLNAHESQRCPAVKQARDGDMSPTFVSGAKRGGSEVGPALLCLPTGASVSTLAAAVFGEADMTRATRNSSVSSISQFEGERMRRLSDDTRFEADAAAERERARRDADRLWVEEQRRRLDIDAEFARISMDGRRGSAAFAASAAEQERERRITLDALADSAAHSERRSFQLGAAAAASSEQRRRVDVDTGIMRAEAMERRVRVEQARGAADAEQQRRITLDFAFETNLASERARAQSEVAKLSEIERSRRIRDAARPNGERGRKRARIFSGLVRPALATRWSTTALAAAHRREGSYELRASYADDEGFGGYDEDSVGSMGRGSLQIAPLAGSPLGFHKRVDSELLRQLDAAQGCDFGFGGHTLGALERGDGAFDMPIQPMPPRPYGERRFSNPNSAEEESAASPIAFASASASTASVSASAPVPLTTSAVAAASMQMFGNANFGLSVMMDISSPRGGGGSAAAPPNIARLLSASGGKQQL